MHVYSAPNRSSMPSTSSGGASAEELTRRHLKELDRYVDVPRLNDSTRLSVYYGMSKQVLAQAQEFRRSHDLERAYIFYKRFLRLALDCIPEHVAYKDGTFSRDKNWLVRERRQALKALEEVNADITAETAAYHRRVPPALGVPPAPSFPSRGASLSAASDCSGEDEDLTRRFQRLRGGGAPSYPGIDSSFGQGDTASEENEAPLSPVLTMPEPSAPPLFLDDGPAPQDAAENEGLSARELDAAFQSLRMADGDDEPSQVRRFYPSLPSSRASQPKGEERMGSPLIPGQANWFSKRGKLRPLMLPAGLVGKFLEIADKNSRKPPDGIETCGVLAGVRDGQGLMRCTTLIIPKQEGTSDTVSMTHEEELISFCCSGKHPMGEEGNLLQLGWIHTHPSQSCFMSSVDIHTHCGYQTMLPEAVAVVVALVNSRRPQVGVFRLTEPEGLQLIQRCELRGFHPHPIPDPQIYKSHHTVVWEESGFSVVDLRS